MLFRRTQSSAMLDYIAGEKVTHFNGCGRGMNGKNKLLAATFSAPNSTLSHRCSTDDSPREMSVFYSNCGFN